MSANQPLPGTDDIVSAFNELGYGATFASVGVRLGIVDPGALYSRYESVEALGAAWLSNTIPIEHGTDGVYAMFSGLVFRLLERLESKRDFSRAWITAITSSAGLHLPQLREMHDSLQSYLIGWLVAHEKTISLPDRMMLSDVEADLADALAGMVVGLVRAWNIDRAKQYRNVAMLTESTAHVVDALLTQRPEFGDAGLLTHLVRLLDPPHRQFLQPVLDTLSKPERAARLLDPVSLLEALRNLRLPPGPQG